MYYVRLFGTALILLTLFCSLFITAPFSSMGYMASECLGSISLQNFLQKCFSIMFFFIPWNIVDWYLRCFVFWSTVRLSIVIFNKSKDLIFTAK